MGLNIGGFRRDSTDADTLANTVDRPFYNGSGAAITGKNWVSLDVSPASGYHEGESMVVGGADQLTLGVLLADCAANDWGMVRTYGPVKDALTDGNVAEGNALMSAAAGACAPFAGGTRVIGVALETDTATAADVFVLCGG
jgi:hypothetical protein